MSDQGHDNSKGRLTMVPRGLSVRGVLVGLAVVVLGTGGDALGDVFNLPAGQKSLEFVTVGDAGNVADTLTGHGAVSYSYQMGKFDITAAQYAQFLNAVAATDPYGLYSPYMAPANNLPSKTFGITQGGSAGSYTYGVIGNPNFPMNQINWGDAARFCNWLANGQPSGVEGPGTTETGSYTLNGATSQVDLMAIKRNPGATYAIPTEDEWYKAAYYNGGSTDAGYWRYPTRNDVAPSNIMSSAGTNNANVYGTDLTNFLTPVGYFAGSPGPYGTFDMGGDVWQWNEASYFGLYRGIRGGSFAAGADQLEALWPRHANPTGADGGGGVGFRIVLVPEPVSVGLLALALAGGRLRRTRRQA